MEGRGFSLSFLSTQALKQVIFFDLLERRLLLLACHLLAGHGRELLRRDLAADDGLAELWVVLVLEIDEEGADFVAVLASGGGTVVVIHRQLDFGSTLSDQLDG